MLGIGYDIVVLQEFGLVPPDAKHEGLSPPTLPSVVEDVHVQADSKLEMEAEEEPPKMTTFKVRTDCHNLCCIVCRIPYSSYVYDTIV